MEELLRQFAGMGGFGGAFGGAFGGGMGRRARQQRPMYRAMMTIPFEQVCCSVLALHDEHVDVVEKKYKQGGIGRTHNWPHFSLVGALHVLVPLQAVKGTTQHLDLSGMGLPRGKTVEVTIPAGARACCF